MSSTGNDLFCCFLSRIMHGLPLFLVATQLAFSSDLLLNETFDNFDNWIFDTSGISAEIFIEPDSAHGGSLVFTNISYCPAANSSATYCYRAELATPQSERSVLFPSCAVEYWAGFSSYIPADWSWTSVGLSSDTIYNFQLHGGDNTGNSPVLGIRVENGRMQANVCGNYLFSSNQAICEYFDLGAVTLGGWTDFVVNSQLAFGEPKGFVKIWRNGQLMVSKYDILTSYNDSKPPYMKLGSYVTSWGQGVPTGYTWSSVSYTALKLGNASSSYEEVYTGYGAPCGSACDLSGGGDGSSVRIDHTAVFVVTVPLGVVVLCSAILYFAHLDQKRAYAEGIAQMKPRNRASTSGSSAGHSKKLLSTSEGRLSTSDNRESLLSGNRSQHIGSMVSRLSAGLLWQEELEFLDVRDPGQAGPDRPAPGEEWRSGTARMVGWYLFGYSFFALMFVIALVLYGRPLAGTRGVLPWTYIDNWSIYQVTMVIVSAVMITIYFLPLLFVRHDFEAGRKFVNDPSFLRRIGVVIPCHKSAGEIGEVVRRVMNYIPPENIIVCDNGNFDGPVDNTFGVIKSVHPRIQYCFIKQGHKTRALWTGAQRLPSHVEYVMHLDDDTHLSDHMVFDEAHFKSTYNKGHVIAVAFLRSSERSNKVTNFTDFWYKITDHFHGTQAFVTTRCFVPGPAGLWIRSKFIEVFAAHPALPFGEDIFGGFTTLNKGYAIRSEMRCMVKTFAPPILLNWGGGGRVQGYGASSLWKQRAHRWTVSALRITGKSLYSFFTYNSRGGILSNVAFRLYRFREYKIILVQLFYIPFCLVLISRGFYFEFLVLKLMLLCLPLLRNLFINYICWYGKPELQVDLETVLLSPFFNFFLIMCAVHGRLKCILWYIPNVPPNHGMLQRCCPRSYGTVNCDEVLDYLDGENSSQDTQNVAYSNSDFSTAVDNPILTTNANGFGGSKSVASGTTTMAETADRGVNSIKIKNITMAEKFLLIRNDTYELFDRDGSSSIVIYVPGETDPVAQSIAPTYQPPEDSSSEREDSKPVDLL